MNPSKGWPSNQPEELTENLNEKMFRINFVCPSCGSTELCQVEQVHLKTPVIETWATEEGYEFELSDEDRVDYGSSEFLSFICDRCGFEPAECSDDLFRWLLNRGMLEEI